MKPRHTFPATALALVLAAASAGAAPPKKPVAPPFDVKAAAAELASGDESRTLSALERVRAAGKAAQPLAPILERLLQRGLPATLAKATLAAVGDVGTTTSSAAVRPYARHRDPELRRAAVGALLKLKGKEAVPTLREALADADARVRGTAASGLGTLGAHDALADLNAALDRKVFEAAASIGQLCRDVECDAFEARIGKIPLDVMTGGFDAILFRGDVGDDHKVKLVTLVREIGTAEAHKYLKDALSRWSGSARVKTALEQAAAATQASPGEAP